MCEASISIKGHRMQTCGKSGFISSAEQDLCNPKSLDCRYHPGYSYILTK